MLEASSDMDGALLIFHKLIEETRNKIQTYTDELTKNEALVRYSLIDPFLNALGWIVSDPSLVRPEFSTIAGRPDYALFDNQSANRSPIAFIGAKALNKSEDLDQYITYCVTEGVKHFIATDGRKWVVYDTFKLVKTPEKKIAEWDIVTDSPRDIIMNALSISRQLNFPVDGINLSLQTKDAVKSRFPASTSPALTASNKLSSPLDDESKRSSPQRPQMVTIKGSKYHVNYSLDILIKTGEWLVSKGKLLPSDCPIASGSKRYIANRNPKHPTGENFRRPFKLENGVWLELHNSSEHTEHLAKLLLRQFGFPEDYLKVDWIDSS